METRHIANAFYATTSLGYAAGEAYQRLVPTDLFVKALDVPLRYHLSSAAGAAFINYVATSRGLSDPHSKSFSDKRIAATSAAVATGIVALESAQANMPGRHFDYVDAGVGMAAIFASAVLMHKMSKINDAKDDMYSKNNQTKTPQGLSERVLV